MAEDIKPPLSVLSAGHYDYNEAILMYSKEIEAIPSNYIAYNNRGLCKIHLGTEPYDVSLIEDGMNDFNIAIELAKKEGVVFESPVHNLALAINILNF